MSEASTISIVFDTTRMRRLLGDFLVVNQNAADFALEIVARELLKDSKLYVPVLTGALKDSGRVEQAPSVSDAIRVFQTIYGDANKVTYAIRQHDVAYNHPSLGMFGPAKYLERPLLQNYPFYQQLFRAEYQIYMLRLRSN